MKGKKVDELRTENAELLEALEGMLELITDAEWTQAQRKACIYKARAIRARAKGRV